MSDTIKDMMQMKDKIKGAGYPEDIFDDSYWTAANTSGSGIRIEKAPDQALRYFHDLSKLTGVKGSFLDIGAGAGNMVKAFRDNGWDAHGCEYSKSGRRIAFERFGIKLESCDLTGSGLPYDTNMFNWAMCNGVLSMIPLKYLPFAIREILRVTKYGVLINVGTEVREVSGTLEGNLHHLTSLSTFDWWRLFSAEGGVDVTSMLPPQKFRYGLAVATEFGGLWTTAPYRILMTINKDK